MSRAWKGHPDWNQMLRSFGNSRGAFMKEKIVREFLYRRTGWITASMEEMLSATSRPKRRKKRQGGEGEVEDDRDESGTILSDDIDDEEEEVEPDTPSAEDNLKHEELTELEREINNNKALHPFPDMCTHVQACKVCGKRVIAFAMPIHVNEAHTNIAEDADGIDDAKLPSIKK